MERVLLGVEDGADFLMDYFFKFQRVKGFEERGEFIFGGFRNRTAIHETAVRGFRDFFELANRF